MKLIQVIDARDLYAGARRARYKNDWRVEILKPVVVVTTEKILPAVLTEQMHQIWFTEYAVDHGDDEQEQGFLLEQTAVLAHAHAREMALNSAQIKVVLEG